MAHHEDDDINLDEAELVKKGWYKHTTFKNERSSTTVELWHTLEKEPVLIVIYANARRFFYPREAGEKE